MNPSAVFTANDGCPPSPIALAGNVPMSVNDLPLFVDRAQPVKWVIGPGPADEPESVNAATTFVPKTASAESACVFRCPTSAAGAFTSVAGSVTLTTAPARGRPTTTGSDDITSDARTATITRRIRPPTFPPRAEP